MFRAADLSRFGSSANSFHTLLAFLDTCDGPSLPFDSRKTKVSHGSPLLQSKTNPPVRTIQGQRVTGGMGEASFLTRLPSGIRTRRIQTEVLRRVAGIYILRQTPVDDTRCCLVGGSNEIVVVRRRICRERCGCWCNGGSKRKLGAAPFANCSSVWIPVRTEHPDGRLGWGGTGMAVSPTRISSGRCTAARIRRHPGVHGTTGFSCGRRGC